MNYPDAIDVAKVGTYPARAAAGGGYVWDEVLEYRVWCHPEEGASDDFEGEDYYRAFSRLSEAEAFSEKTPGAEEPLALILQREYIDEPAPGQYVHVVASRMVEWRPEFLQRPQRTPFTIPDFLAADAPANRLDIIRGLVRNPREAK